MCPGRAAAVLLLDYRLFIAYKSSSSIMIVHRHNQYEHPAGHATCSFEQEKYWPEVCRDEDNESAESTERCRSLLPDEYRYDKDNCELELSLAPGDGVKIGLVCCSYTGNWENTPDVSMSCF